ncbi:MAG: hypothetical protein LC746_13200 [Acidobacteria bacterium]|nr:hypothetical protein [Acidobacteriota bacterium]
MREEGSAAQSQPSRASRSERARDAAAVAVFVAFFLCVFGWAIFRGEYLIGGDAFFYMHPLRASAWRMISQGHAPLWTPHVFSGFPLLAQTQLALGYPLTWLYLVLPSHLAEQIYIYAPFVLSPVFLYAYARQVGRSRTAAVLAGLTFAYGGYMTNVLGMIGAPGNSLAWLPLLLTACERARTRPFARCLLLASVAYSLSVLNGHGQNFLYAAVIALAYALSISLFDPPRDDGDTRGTTGATRAQNGRLARLRRWRPLAVVCGAVAFAAGLSAFQILETMRAQRRSVRGALGYDLFIEYAYTPRTFFRSLAAPLHNFFDATPHVTPLALLLALAAVAFAARRKALRDPRVVFWSAVALIAFALMLGDATPLNRLLYRVPVFNLFRRPSRHAFEWTFALSVLAAYGWDAINDFASRRLARLRERFDARASVASALLLAASALVGAAWYVAARSRPYGAAEHAAEANYLWWKLAFTLAVLSSIAAALCVASRARRGALLACCVVLASFAEPYVLVRSWWQGTAKSAARLTTPARATRYLRQFAPEENRVYMRAFSDTEETSADPRFDALDVPALYGLQDASGYEPLLLARVSRALGDVSADALTSRDAPGDPARNADSTLSLFAARSHVLDLLNATHAVAFPNLRARETDPPPDLTRPLGQSGLDASRWQRVAEFDGVVVLRNARSCPRAWLVAEAVSVDGEEALRRIRGEPPNDSGASTNDTAAPHANDAARDFDPLRTALVEDAPAELPQLPGGALPPNASSRVASYEPNRIVVETDAPQPALLVVSEIFYPGWEASVDGKRERIRLTDFLLRGVAVPAGRHRVEMRYSAPPARNGAIISALTLCCLIALAIYARRGARSAG